MKRVLLLAAAGIAALAIVLPATAAAATFRGVVIAKKQARHALVTASPNGVVRTTRVRGSLARYRIGRIVAVNAASLPDGTFTASKIKLVGVTHAARFRGAVVSASKKNLIVSAGLSLVRLALRSGNASALKAGDSLVLGATLKGGALQTSMKRVRKVGHEDTLELEGIYLATADDGTIELAVEHRGRVFVHVPDDLVVPDFQAGDVIALLVKVEDDGSFTLIKADDESDDGDDDGGGIGGDKFSVAGVLSELTPNEVAVKIDGDAHRIASCDVPHGFDLSGLEVGQYVYMTCTYGDGHRTLVSLKRKEGGDEYLVAIGRIIHLSDESVTVMGDGEPVTCAVPDGFDLSEFDVDDPVVMKCVKADGAWTIAALQKRDLPPPPPTSVEVSGPITDLDSETITVAGEDEDFSCDVPDGANLSAFHVSDTVQMRCLGSDEDGYRLKRLQSSTAVWEDGSPPPPPPPPPPPSYVQVSGPITSLSGSSITVQSEHEPVTCAVADNANLSAFHVTNYVAMKCAISDGLRLKRLQSSRRCTRRPSHIHASRPPRCPRRP